MDCNEYDDGAQNDLEISLCAIKFFISTHEGRL